MGRPRWFSTLRLRPATLIVLCLCTLWEGASTSSAGTWADHPLHRIAIASLTVWVLIILRITCLNFEHPLHRVEIVCKIAIGAMTLCFPLYVGSVLDNSCNSDRTYWRDYDILLRRNAGELADGCGTSQDSLSMIWATHMAQNGTGCISLIRDNCIFGNGNRPHHRAANWPHKSPTQVSGGACSFLHGGGSQVEIMIHNWASPWTDNINNTACCSL